MSKKQPILNGGVFRRKGTWFHVKHEPDVEAGPPESHSDGHGVVLEWQPRLSEEEVTSRGLRELHAEAHSRGEVIYYDVRATRVVAARDKWGTTEADRERAIEADFEFLRGWHAGDWVYVGVVVRALTGKHKGWEASLWGLESNDEKHLSDTARDLADEILRGGGAP